MRWRHSGERRWFPEISVQTLLAPLGQGDQPLLLERHLERWVATVRHRLRT
jgi:hypothetical protein